MVGTRRAGSSTQDEHGGTHQGLAGEGRAREGGSLGPAPPLAGRAMSRQGAVLWELRSLPQVTASPRPGVWVGNGSLCASPGPACTLGCYLVASIFRAGRLVASGPVYMGGRPLCRMGLA